MEPEDLLYTNAYINEPEVNKDIDEYTNNQFKQYIEKERDDKKQDTIQEIVDNKTVANRYKRHVTTYINVDSRDRDKAKFPNANNFNILLGKTYYNVKSVKLSKIEFPNTNAVINSSNNLIYWRNLSDIADDKFDTVTGDYPVYKASVKIGSYIATKLQSEISKKMSDIRRKDNNNFHYFETSLNIETDVVSFKSLSLKQLSANPIMTTINTGNIKVIYPTHGLVTGDVIYILNSRTVAGITGDIINTEHTVTVLNENEFTFDVNATANESLLGGGLTIKIGKPDAFQLLFGDFQNTIAPNIGFPYENSSQLVTVNLDKQLNLIQLQIKFTENINLTSDYINSIIQIDNVSPSLNVNTIITKIINHDTILVKFLRKLDEAIFPPNGIATFSLILADNTTISLTKNISSITNYNVDSIYISTYTPHNYTYDDIGRDAIFANTRTVPSLDGPFTIDNVLSPTEFVINGFLLNQNNSATNGDSGFIQMYNPFQTFTHQISSIVTGDITTITTSTDHWLQIGDEVKFYNVKTTPSITEKNRDIYKVIAVPTLNTFIINVKTTNVSSLTNGYIGVSMVKMTFPNHGFNRIVSITGGVGGIKTITTFLPHKLTVGRNVRISQSNCVPSIDNAGSNYSVVSVVSDHIFTINVGISLTQDGTFGLLGIRTDEFIVYNVDEFDTYDKNYINGTSFKIKYILDENDFIFSTPTRFSSKSVSGGGNDIYLHSRLHGYTGIQNNVRGGEVFRSINLEGENYTFLKCPQLSSMVNTGKVSDIFARITLDQSPGGVVFNFLSNPKVFNETPLDTLRELDFSIVNYDGRFYEFNDLDYSFVLEITEVIDTTDQFNISSRRGVIDN